MQRVSDVIPKVESTKEVWKKLGMDQLEADNTFNKMIVDLKSIKAAPQKSEKHVKAALKEVEVK